MKHVQLATGPFKLWPFFQPQEIETIAADDLRSLGLMPDRPSEVNVDQAVVKLFGFDPVYEDAGAGVLGFIRFGTAKPEKILLHSSLAEIGDITLERRRRSTLAHECGHGRLHVGPFTELMQAKKAGHGTERVRDPRHHANFICRSDDVRDNECEKPPAVAGPARWERMAEWQANRYMACMLAPADLVRMAVADLLAVDSVATVIALDATGRAALAPEISRCFNVSRELAGIRLEELFPASGAQRVLFAA